MFGDGAISSSESPAPSALRVPERGIRKLYFPSGRSGVGIARLPSAGHAPSVLT